ncbi:complex I subunit 5 family protein [Desulfurivibrio sp. D14AmB]|uniref:complex I subunit 5 family protein n=1 Tax=Desulfurivibrio sp. D14AmB TaxID=3374370 RepID=UPI00376EF869
MTPPLPPPWPILLIVLPLAAALLAFALPRLAGWAALLTMAAVPALLLPLTALVSPGSSLLYPLGGWPPALGIGLLADGLSLWLLWLGAAVNIAVGFYARRYFLSAPGGATTASGRYFPPLWLMLWAAFNGLLLSADLFNIYVGLELLGLAAVCLAALGDGREARRAALRYLLLNLFGSLSFLLAVVLIYRQTGSLNLALFRELTAPDPLITLALALLSLGLIIKSALFPLHFWLPPAHAQAPAPVSALLSALVVKASLYLLLRVWLALAEGGALDPTPLFQLFGILGAGAIFWGSLQALRCAGFKELIAYSTVAQMGYLFLVFPLLTGPEPASALYGLLFFLAAHALAKAALFLVAGTIAKQRQPAGKANRPLLISDLTGLSRTLPLTSLTLALAAVSLMGLPPSGGFVGKWYLLHAALTGRQWWWTAAIIGGGLLSLAYLLRPVARTFTRSESDRKRGGGPGQPAVSDAGKRQVVWSLEGPALLLALIAILLGIFPWLPLEWLGGLPNLSPIQPGRMP